MRKVVGFVRRAVSGFVGNKCPLHAAALTYFGMLALVPALCCVLATAKMCGVDRYARAQIDARIDAMIKNVENGQDDGLAALTAADEAEREKKRIAAGEFAKQAREISDGLFERIDSFDVGTFGWIGFCCLLWTVISTLASVETSFNSIFDVPKNRPVWKRAYMYLLLVVALPVMGAVAMSLPVLSAAKSAAAATMGQTWLTRRAADWALAVLDATLFKTAFTFATASLSFAFFLWAMPNCKVRFRSALYGGAVTAALFGGWMKLCAVAQVGIANSSALYGSFAFLPIVLAWNCMSWQIVLFGANVVREFERSADARGKEA